MLIQDQADKLSELLPLFDCKVDGEHVRIERQGWAMKIALEDGVEDRHIYDLASIVKRQFWEKGLC